MDFSREEDTVPESRPGDSARVFCTGTGIFRNTVVYLYISMISLLDFLKIASMKYILRGNFYGKRWSGRYLRR
jgi:hypothetical protein